MDLLCFEFGIYRFKVSILKKKKQSYKQYLKSLVRLRSVGGKGYYKKPTSRFFRIFLSSFHVKAKFDFSMGNIC
jgi:hypothetical protein